MGKINLYYYTTKHVEKCVFMSQDIFIENVTSSENNNTLGWPTLVKRKDFKILWNVQKLT